MVEQELVENGAPQDELDNGNKKKYDWQFFKPILFKYGVSVLIFVVVLLTSWLLFKKYFYTDILVGDDAREYITYLETGFFRYIFHGSRPLTYFLMGLGFALFGQHVPSLMFYVCLSFGAMITTLFVVARQITKSTLITLFVVILAIFSRLNWYYYATYFGLMENFALLCLILSVYFTIQFVALDKKLLPYILMCVFYVGSVLFHERYMFCFVPIVIVSLIIWKGWKKKLIFAGVATFLFAFYMFYRFVIMKSTPFVVTGNTAISMNVGTLLSNFWQNFVNMFTLRETSPWLVGVTNADLDNTWQFLFAITSFILFIAFISGITLCIYFAVKKKYSYLIVSVILGVYCAIMLAAGSVSPTRVEPRWTYSGQVPFFIFIGLTIQMILDFFKKEDLAIGGSGKKNWKLKVITIIGLAAILVPFVSLSIYTQENKKQYYINDDIERSQRYETSIRQAMKKENKDKLYIICDEYNDYYLNLTIPLWGDVDDYTIVTYDKMVNEPVDLDETFVCICSGDVISRPYIPTLTDAIFEDYWPDGQSYSIFVYGSIDELYIRLGETHFPNLPNNRITFYNGNDVVDHCEIYTDMEFFIPLHQGCINRITLEADYTYCPADYGGIDVRKLTCHILRLGGLGEQMVPSITEPWVVSQWMEGHSYSFYAYGSIDELYIKFNKTRFVDMPNNKVTIYNSGTVIVDKYEIDSNMEFFVPLKKDAVNRITIEADYTYCPAEHGGSDRRDLSLFISRIGGLGEPITPSNDEPILKNAWMEGKSYSLYVYGVIDELYLRLNQTQFFDMPNNKITIYYNGETLVENFIIFNNPEFFIPLKKDAINRISFVADYTYCPAEHGGSDQRELSLFIAQFGGPH